MPAACLISAIIPARNEEAGVARAVESLAAQAEIGEIIVVNDDSTDRTPEILSNLKFQIANLRVLDAQGAPPDGWTGKNRAAWLGAQAARGEWLLFTDADVTHVRGAAARALADAAAHNAALVSYSPEQETPAWWERAVIPLVFSRLAARYSYARVSDPGTPDAAANGQFLMIRRDAYESAGGHAAVAAEILEDVALARLVKRAGHRLYFAPGQGIARARMYASPGAMWQGWRKNLYLLMGRSPAAVAAELLFVVPWIALLLLALGWVNALFPALGAALLAARHAVYALELRQNRHSARDSLYYLPGAFFYAAALLASAWSCRRGEVEWKGRKYPVDRR
jgi:glycosyltransferase involved in cell wall biosynthesis